MRRVAVIQARTGSTRLPGKALLCLRGLPLAILAARRAANSGWPVILATSDQGSDDALARLAAEHGITCHRGPLDDVLGRFTGALSAFGDDTLVARLTADNPVPDGALLDAVAATFEARQLDYITTTAPGAGLPYGVSVELTRLRHLRAADAEARDGFDREHVTPFIIRRFGAAVFTEQAGRSAGHYRMTVDGLDDYLSIVRVFPAQADPVHVPWQDLVARAGLGLYQPTGQGAVSGLVLGGAQLGMAYGIANRHRPGDPERHDMIKTAIGNGIGAIDTARAYGRSEEVIGAVLGSGWAGRCRVVTKLSPLADLPPDAGGLAVRGAVEASVLRSCRALRLASLPVVLLHRASHIDGYNGAILAALSGLQAEGLVETLGVSVQSPAELRAALAVDVLGHIQMPCHLLDWRWDEVLPDLVAARQRRSLTVHLRSSLLQGLLTSPKADHWRRAHVAEPRPIRQWLHDLARAEGRTGIADLCLAWARGRSWADGVVVGMDGRAQLDDNLALFRRPPLGAIDLSDRPRLPLATLDPSTWLPEGA